MRAVAILSLAASLALAGAVAVAQTPPQAPPAASSGSAPAAPTVRSGSDQATPQRQGPRRLTRADRDALTDARIAGIQAGLKLSPEQQRLWAPVEQAIRAQAAERTARIEERLARMEERRQRTGRLDLMQRLERRADRVTRRAERVERRAEVFQALVTSMRPFWASLTDDQRRILPILMRERQERRPWRRASRDRHHGSIYHGMHGGMHRP
jgi:hypothetical protein